jgi:hypothetical protein
MDAQGLLDVIEKSSQLDKAEDTEPAIWSVRFYVHRILPHLQQE